MNYFLMIVNIKLPNDKKMEEDIADLRKNLALALAKGRVTEILRELKTMPITTLEALSAAGSQNQACSSDLIQNNIGKLETDLKKLDFYVCGILMHRILEEK